ncbi:CAAX prenyl protease-related protein [Tautonia sociabilis]|uniref:CAAX prenyl protease-related protein n=1 Tax=Tautonia sociabilis TaxID=2080755 RepID=A0A432MQB6_9BACT|nr:CAAX prenyl protease-related protein [Tautonia sociabilis]RUL89674.1 CAAX prenyl protease-related protein [Tautonia sociabilis]
MSTPSQSEVASLWTFVPYVSPMLAYVLLTQAEAYIPEDRQATWYPVAYAIKAVLVLAILVLLGRRSFADLKPMPGPGGWALAVGIGLAVTAVWVGIDGHYPPLPFVGGTREAFDPSVLPPAGRWAFLAVRLFGLVLLVPVFEELFWRSFLMRVVIDPDDFRRVPIGRVTPLAAVITSVGFMLVHPEWLPALLTGLAWAWLLHRTRSVSACVASHLVANLALGIYVMATGSYQFW